MILFRNFPVLVFFSLLIATTSANADVAEITTPAAPTIAASGYILMNHNTGKVLAENNADVKLAPASLTKIMSVYVVFREISNGHLHLDDLVTISQKAWQTPGSRMFVEVGNQVKVEDLLKGVIIQSGNDASVALAEHIAGDEATFAAMMNQHAERLGMKNSHFEDSNGLPIENHYTTARDLAILTQALVKEFPDYYRWFSQKEFTFNNIVQHNRNQLLSRDETVDGVKTGFTDAAGYCLVASALRNDMRLISVVMGASSPNARANENQNLLNYGFRFFESHKLYQGKTSLAEARIWKGDIKNIPLGLAEDLYASIPRGHYADLKAAINIDKKITAPVKEGTKVGTVNVTLKDEVIANKDLIALKTVEQGNIIQRLYDSAMMMLEKPDGQ
ncbi:MAG: D-alanyl-D-alanine carboxypeptidase [Methylobacter sp.]|jgi:D-alanyl-D-alanine carboxypeptidase (penicillin-binding protein 5/6)|uniref:D-alanyl-D-alanine carboxypeptidase family protein n=1 Tax=Methylobacter sp. TaxID=2051955 RepID=UPI0025F11216|nr:D-alanyl-D-alanine carboxypeptidase family protein [Methylobacter sp.]MCK9620509.1 D-alanyl-D-alanine carboxypeptidase [Methylobacter sp.]